MVHIVNLIPRKNGVYIFNSRSLFLYFNYSVRLIAVLIILNLMELYLKGPQNILRQLVQNPAILEDCMSLWVCI